MRPHLIFCSLLAGLLSLYTHLVHADYDQCKTQLMQQAQQAGLSKATTQRLFHNITRQQAVLDALDSQPEFTTDIWDYLAALVDAERIADGQAALREHADTLQRIEAQYGVDPATVVAVWGVESDFGNIKGKRVLVESLTTLACEGRRQAFFRSELMALLKLMARGDLPTDTPITGSWAGAFGQTQFMPSTYDRLAVDFDGDDRRDLVDSIPDALASTAHYLKTSGWRSGQPWGVEVRLPDNLDTRNIGRKNRKAVSEWLKQGVSVIDSRITLPSTRHAAIIQPASGGPAWMVFKNYDVIYSYNASQSYALAIALLSNGFRGGSYTPETAWPTDDPGLSRKERREVQHWLLSQGHDIGEVDGVLGSKSRAAIMLEQPRLKLAATGRAGKRFLERIRQESR